MNKSNRLLYLDNLKVCLTVLVIALQNAIDGIWMGAFGKFMFIGVVTTIVSFGLTWLLRMIPGVKKIL